MRSLASRMSVMTRRRRALSLCARQRIGTPGPLHHPSRTRRARFSSRRIRHRVCRRKPSPRAKTVIAPSPEFPPCATKSPPILQRTRNICRLPRQHRDRARLQNSSVFRHDGAARARRRSPLSRSRLPRLSPRSRSAWVRFPCRSSFRPATTFSPTSAEIAAKITRRTRMLITNSPGNPTGTVYTDAVQRGLAELAVKHDLWVLSDEIYARIIYGGEYLSMLQLSRHGRAHAHHRRLLQELRHDRMAAGLHRRAARSCGGPRNAGRQQLHLRRRVHPVRRHRRVCATAKGILRTWSPSSPGAANSSSAT